MNVRFTLLLLVLLVVIGGLVGITQVLRSGDVKERGGRLYRLSSDELVNVAISMEGEEITFVREDTGWFIKDGESGEKVPVDIKRWGGVPFLLGGPQVSKNLSAGNEELGNLTSYGLDPPRGRINLTPRRGNAVEVQVGDLTPNQDGYYVKVAGSDTLYVMHNEWVDVLAGLVTEPPYPIAGEEPEVPPPGGAPPPGR